MFGVKKCLIIGGVGDTAVFPSMKVDPPPLFENLSKNIKPIVTKSRRYRPADSSFIKDEITRMIKADIIEPSISPWRAQVLVTSDSVTHKKRLVVDYGDTINRFTELDAYPMPNMSQMINDISQYKYFSTLDLKSAYHQIPIKSGDRKYTGFEAIGKLWQFKRAVLGLV